MKQKTTMQEVYENFNLMSDADFKAWMLNTDLIEKEKEVIIDSYYEGAKGWVIEHYGDATDYDKEEAERYYNETFNTE